MNLEVSLLPARSLVVWARGTGLTRPPLAGGRLGRDTTPSHISGIAELSIPGLAFVLWGGWSEYSATFLRGRGWKLQRAVHFLCLSFLRVETLATKQFAD